MNSEEGVSLAKMAVTVLLVVLVIGAVVGIVYGAYSWFTSGTDKLGDQVVSIERSSFSQYDDTTVSGDQVLSALKTYRESDVAIFIANKNTLPANFSMNNPGTSITCDAYCAVPDAVGNTSTATALPTRENDQTISYVIEIKDGKFTCGNYIFADDQVTLQRNTNFNPTTTKSASGAYVKRSANWYAKLVYSDATDDIAGVLFVQLN